MKINIYSYLLTLITLIIVDAIWLSLMATRFYSKHLAHILADKLTLWPVVIFYPFYAAGLWFFVVRHGAMGQLSMGDTFWRGLFLGLLAYSAYNLTNQASLRDWPLVITIVDLLWGGLLSAIVASIAVALSKRLFA